MELTINGRTYRTGKMDCRTQFHIARRLTSVVSHLGPLFKSVLETATFEGGDFKLNRDMTELALPIMKAIGEMSDADADYVINTCLKVVQRQQQGGAAWANVVSPNGQMMFQKGDDALSMPEMLRLVGVVIQDNLWGFTPGHQPSS